MVQPESHTGEVEASRADLHHDKYLIPTGEYLKALAARIFVELEATTPRPPKVRRDATQRRLEMVENIVANFALLTAYRPKGSRLIVSASATRKSRYERQRFPLKAFVGVVEGLGRLGHIERHRGSYGGLRTTLCPTVHLLEHLAQSGETPALGRVDGAETIQLRATRGRRKPKVLVDYDDTSETVRMRSEMDTINTALNSIDITLDGKLQSPVHMVRMFQMDSPDAPPRFDLHGRLYGGFWEYMPRRERHLLQIDGQQVAEVDFSGMFVQLAYALAGAAPPQGDTYEGTSMPREAAKVAMSALLCRTGPMRKLPTHLKDALGEGWNGHRVTSMMESRHPAIAHLFCKGIGLKLMHLESRILVATLLKLNRSGIVALPIHDGLLVPIKHQAACVKIMECTSQQFVGWRLPARLKR